MMENSETICAFTISLEHKTTYAHFNMFFFPHEENIVETRLKTAQAESQEVSSLTAVVHQAILNKINKLSKSNRKRINNYN